MGGKGGDSSGQYRQDEQERQDAIRKGTASINDIFDGGVFGVGEVSNPVAGETYFLADGSEYVAPGAPVANAQLTGTADPPELFSGTETRRGFDDQFFDEQRQAYLDFAMPQLEDQRAGASRELVYSLARSGQLEGSARAAQQSELSKLYDTEAQNVASKALDYENKSRTGVEDARADLISTLNATGDATGASNSALARSATLSQPEAYSPLADLFTSYTSALGTSAAAERARSYGWGGQQQQTGSPTWYGAPGSSVSVKG